MSMTVLPLNSAPLKTNFNPSWVKARRQIESGILSARYRDPGCTKDPDGSPAPALDDLGSLSCPGHAMQEFQDGHSRIHVGKKFLLEGNVPDSIEIPIYRITQEAFDNIAAHSGQIQ